MKINSEIFFKNIILRLLNYKNTMQKETRNRQLKNKNITQNEENIDQEIEQFLNFNQIFISKKDYTKIIDKYGRDLFLKKICELVQNDIVSFPFKKFFSKDVKFYFQNLKDYQMNYDHKPHYIPKFIANSMFQTDKKTMVVNDELYEDVDIISDLFNENVRLNCKKLGRINCYERWKQGINEYLTFIIKNGQDINTKNLRESIYQVDKNYYECTQFKSSVSKEIFERYNSRKVLDFSSGYGDRLLGAISSNCVIKYTGFDPNTDLKKGHDSMIKKFCPLNNKNSKNFKINYLPFENGDILNNDYDTVFTSPPFFELEDYVVGEQSIKNFKTFESWAKDFLFFSVDKCWEHIKENGYFILYIGDYENHKIVEPVNLYLESKDDSNFVETISFANYEWQKIKRRYIFVWQKKRSQNKNKIYRMEKAKELQSNYPNLF